MAAPSDTLRLAQALWDGGFTLEQAQAMSAAIADAMSGADLVTKQDLTTALRDLERRLTIRVGGMLVAVVGVIVAAMRLFPAR